MTEAPIAGIPQHIRATIDKLSLPQALLLQGLLLDHSIKLIGLTKKPDPVIKNVSA